MQHLVERSNDSIFLSAVGAAPFGLDPAGRALDPAGRALDPAGRALDRAGQSTGQLIRKFTDHFGEQTSG
jgi:hypothetical protein